MVYPLILLYLLTLVAPLAVFHVSLWLVYDTVLHAPAFDVQSAAPDFGWFLYLARVMALPQLAAATGDFLVTVVLTQMLQAWRWSAFPERAWFRLSLPQGGCLGFIAGSLYGAAWSLLVIFRCEDAFTSATFAHHVDAYVWWPLIGGLQGAVIGLGAAYGLIRFAQDVAQKTSPAASGCRSVSE